MMDFEITSPSGKKYTVTAPEGATQDQVLSYAQSQYAHLEQPAHNPTEGMSGYEKFMAGAGKAVVDTGRGLQQLLTRPDSGPIPQVFDQKTRTMVDNPLAIAARAADEQKYAAQQSTIDESRKLDTPLMNTGAGLAGNISGAIATTMLPAGAVARGAQVANMGRAAALAKGLANPNTLKAAIAAGAATGAIQPVATDESRLENTVVGALGGAVGTGVAKVIGKVAQPVVNKLTDAAKRAVQTLKDAGVPLDLSQLTGSRLARSAKLILADNPLVGDGGFLDEQRAAYNGALLKTIGEDATAATPDVMSAAKTRIGSVMNDVAERNPINYDKTLETKLAQVVKDARSTLEDQQFSVISRQADEILNKAAENGGKIDGKAYQNIKTILDDISMGADQSKGKAARAIREVLDDGLMRSASGDDYAAMKLARSQYRNMKQIETAIATDESGNISPSKLANTLGTKKNAAQSKYGQGDQTLVNLAKAGKEILPEKTGNSGSAARAAAQILGPGAIAAGSSLANDGDLSTAMKYGAMGIAAPYAARAVLHNPAVSSYLANGLGNPTARALLNSPQSKLAVGAPLKIGAIQYGLGRLNAPQQ